jgi:hypothetical protein
MLIRRIVSGGKSDAHIYSLAPRIGSQHTFSFQDCHTISPNQTVKQILSSKMPATCAGQCYTQGTRESSLLFRSSNRSSAHRMGILPLRSSRNSVHSPVRSHHLRTSRTSYILQEDILLGDNCLWSYSNAQLHFSGR